MGLKNLLIRREITVVFNWILDNVVPPFLRDSKFFTNITFGIVYGKHKNMVMEFKEKAYFISDEEYSEYYRKYAETQIVTKRETDLNQKSVKKIISSIVGDSIVDIGCGKGYLARRIVKELNKKIVAVDLHISDSNKSSSNPIFIESVIEKLPFESNSFDTVICTHTLEHIKEIKIAIAELRRITKKRLIIVVPRQREYKWTFDYHIHFFPYLYSFKNVMENDKAFCETCQNDIVYIEDKN
jgi:ubiquinone/menaquinone biosynthesis C-methylase UbiE